MQICYCSFSAASQPFSSKVFVSHTKLWRCLLCCQLAQYPAEIDCFQLATHISQLTYQIYYYIDNVKGMVHLNTIFSYMKFNKICNYTTQYVENYLYWFSHTCISTFYILNYHSHGWYHLEKRLSQLSKNGCQKVCVNSIII